MVSQAKIAANLQNDARAPVRMLINLGLATIPTGKDNGAAKGGEVTDYSREHTNPLRMLLCHVALDGSNIRTPLTAEWTMMQQLISQQLKRQQVMPVRLAQNVLHF